MVVSIHAPAGGATIAMKNTLRALIVSIHAPAGGATLRGYCAGLQLYVSIHAPAGGATSRLTYYITQVGVSIHAPAGGATCYSNSHQRLQKFQSTRPQGARPGLHMAFWMDIIMFQSTRPQGARLYSCNIRHFKVLESPKREPLRMSNNILRKPDMKTYNHNNIMRISISRTYRKKRYSLTFAL